jgi:hypothetical protein
MTKAIFDPVSCQHKTKFSLRRAQESAHIEYQNPQLACAPLGGGSCLRRTGHPFAVSGPKGPSQKIESVFSASPETVRREPREFDLRRSLGQVQDLAVCVLCDPDVFSLRWRGF